MKPRYIQTAQEFLAIAGDALLVDEIRHSLTFGIAERLSHNSHVFGADAPWFLVIEHKEQICATAIRTPPYRPIVSHLCGDVEIISSELTQSIHAIDPNIPGVLGSKEIAEPFTQQWCASYGCEVAGVMAQRVYKLTELVEPNYADGRLRLANPDDEEIVMAWAEAFHKEATGDGFSHIHHQRFHDLIRNGDLYLWDNTVPISMAARTRPTRSGISISAVYTPPSNRNHGYATSCVAALCKELLTKYDFCVLYTDLANPVSNSIYQKIGFKEYCDSVQYTYSQRAE